VAADDNRSPRLNSYVEAVIPLALIEAPEADVGGLPNWLRGFDSRRPLCI